MPVELYETMFLLDSNRMATVPEVLKNNLHAALEKHGAEILVARMWDERKIAYNIRRSNTTHKKGTYYIVYYKMESTKQEAMNEDFRLSMTEYLLRHLTAHIDYRWEEAMLDVARNDQAPGFALRGMQEETSPTDINPALVNDPGADFAGGYAGGQVSGPVGGGGGGGGAGGAGRRPPRREDDKPE